VNGNKSMLLLVLMNLVKNAADALNGKGNSRGAPAIAIHARREGDCVRLSVRDNGPGVAPEHQARVYDILGMGDHPEGQGEGDTESSGRVFKHFFTTKEAGAGMGMGLGICRRIVRAHGGRISFRSEPGAGCEFVVELPLVQQLEVAA
jgi:signal transduction histidine kinase